MSWEGWMLLKIWSFRVTQCKWTRTYKNDYLHEEGNLKLVFQMIQDCKQIISLQDIHQLNRTPARSCKGTKENWDFGCTFSLIISHKKTSCSSCIQCQIKSSKVWSAIYVCSYIRFIMEYLFYTYLFQIVTVYIISYINLK